MQAKITQALAERAPVPPKGTTVLYADTELRGFYLIVSPTKRSFYVQSLVNGRQVRTKFGEFPALDAKQARDLARKTLVAMRAGSNPNEERRQARARGITLREALDLHLAARTLSPRTSEAYRYSIEHYLPDWLGRTLAEIGADRRAVRERHVRLTQERGKTTADNTMRVLRSLYNRALREHPDLPPNPTTNVDFHGMRRRPTTLVEPGALPRWATAVEALANPIRRDFQRFVLLSGMRRTAAAEMRWEHVDTERGVVRVPNPKGGTARAFDLPLSAAMVKILERRRERNGELHRNSPWVWPASSESGHVEEPKEKDSRVVNVHQLRATFISLAVTAGLDPYTIKLLVNHSRAGDVTLGYVSPSVEHLRQAQERVTARIADEAGGLEALLGT